MLRKPRGTCTQLEKNFSSALSPKQTFLLPQKIFKKKKVTKFKKGDGRKEAKSLKIFWMLSCMEHMKAKTKMII